MTEQSSLTIKTIIFDLGKVIVDFDHGAICRRLAEHSPYPPDVIYEKIFNSGLESLFDKGLLDPEAFYREASTAIKAAVHLDLFRNMWTDIFSLNTGTEQLIRRLTAYRLLCLSNTNQWQFQFCMEAFSVLRCFDDFIVSFSIGARKPEKKIYQHALSKAGCAPAHCLYIDDIQEFVKAAEGLGMRAVRFLSADQLERDLKRWGVL